MNMTQKANITNTFGNKVAAYLEANAAGWVIERFSDMGTVPHGRFAGKLECVAFAMTPTGQMVLQSSLAANR